MRKDSDSECDNPGQVKGIGGQNSKGLLPRTSQRSKFDWLTVVLVPHLHLNPEQRLKLGGRLEAPLSPRQLNTVQLLIIG